ncbi:MAG TPA: hypothetical protein DEB06_09250 [Phycisphaerales bacterium]|nr:hypothetical protein [Phycisphaerales bacterium]
MNPWPQLMRRGAVARMRQRCAERRMLCLTYDDGPGADLTPRVLDTLARHGARATFFLLGRNALAHPTVADRVRDAGHECACHTMEHLNGWRVAGARAARDVDEGYAALSRWLPSDARFRPPFGKLCAAHWRTLRTRRAPVDWWTIDSGDTTPFGSPLPDPESVWRRVEQDSGAVVLLHDMDREREHPARAEFVLKVTDLLLTRARSAGLRAATLSELFSEHGS